MYSTYFTLYINVAANIQFSCLKIQIPKNMWFHYFIILMKLTVRKQIKLSSGKQEFTELSWCKHYISIFPMGVNVYVFFRYEISVNSCFPLDRVDPQDTSWVERTINDPFITYWNILRDSKYGKINDFGTKIEFESWVNLPKIIKNIKKHYFHNSDQFWCL